MCMQIFYPCTLHVKIKQFHQRILSNIQHFSASPLRWLQVQQLSFTRHHTQSCLGLRRWRRKGEPNGLCLEPRLVEPTQQTLPWQQSQLVCLFVLTTGLSFHPSSTQGSLNTKTMYFLLSPSSKFQVGIIDSSYTTKSVSQYTPEYMTNQSELFLRRYFFLWFENVMLAHNVCYIFWLCSLPISCFPFSPLSPHDFSIPIAYVYEYRAISQVMGCAPGAASLKKTDSPPSCFT